MSRDPWQNTILLLQVPRTNAYNLYLYAAANPISLNDPSGWQFRWSLDACLEEILRPLQNQVQELLREEAPGELHHLRYRWLLQQEIEQRCRGIRSDLEAFYRNCWMWIDQIPNARAILR